MRESGQPTVERKAARKRSFVIMVEELGAGWYFLDIKSPFEGVFVMANRELFAEITGRPFLFLAKVCQE